MSTGLKVIIGVVCGFAAGFAGGFFAHKKINDLKFSEIEEGTEEENAKGEETEKTSETPAQKVDLPASTLQDLPEDPDKLKMALQGKKSFIEADKEAKKAYEKVWNTVKNYSNEENANELPVQEDFMEEVDGDFINEIENVEPEDVVTQTFEPPHPISFSDFYNDRPEYDKITITWYVPDKTFIDEREEVIADISSYIGDIDIDKLFKETMAGEDPDVRFIRNEQYGSDYEIIRMHKSWAAESVGGSE